MPLTPTERKERMPHGGQRRAAKRVGAFDSYITAVMTGQVFPKTKRTKLKLRRAQVAIATEMGLPVETVFPPEELGRAIVAPPLARAS